jgi:CheY-like chemotaxis protein/two-component sensor histidine kinase
MQHAGRHLLALLNDVLDMAKITTQHLELDYAPFDLAVALHGAGQTVAALAEQKSLTLIVEPLQVASPRVLGDAYRLHQVLLNLLSNAIKFTETGSVRLGANVLRDEPHQLVLRFWVEDTGIGIMPNQQEHIFEAFTQASAETSSRFGGTGLGLSISQQLVSQMGGVLRLCSEPGIGTTFAFQLALSRPDETTTAQQLASPEASCESLRGLKVLLAEDNLVNQWIAVVVLEQWGMQVQAVDNGLDALAYLSEHTYDLAILDIKMPGLSGVEVTIAIRQHPDAVRAAIPIIALTANAFQADRAGYLAAGMNACLTKPYEEADLCQLLLQLTVGASTAGGE